ncbi:hypothetical protein ACR31S_00895 [Streptococcus iniae]
MRKLNSSEEIGWLQKLRKAWLDRISVEGVDYLLSQKGITDIPTHSGSLDVSKISVHKNPYHCAITILPEYQNEVKILVASEDMKQEEFTDLKHASKSQAPPSKKECRVNHLKTKKLLF